jgi:hypothetical protein
MIINFSPQLLKLPNLYILIYDFEKEDTGWLHFDNIELL